MKLIGKKQACKLLSCKLNALEVMIADGKLKSYPIERRLRDTWHMVSEEEVMGLVPRKDK